MKEAIALLEKALVIKAKISPDYSEYTIKLAADEMMVCIVDALAILKQPKAQPSSEFTKEKMNELYSKCNTERIALQIKLDTSEASRKELLEACKLALHNEHKRWGEIKAVLVAAIAKAEDK